MIVAGIDLRNLSGCSSRSLAGPGKPEEEHICDMPTFEGTGAGEDPKRQDLDGHTFVYRGSSKKNAARFHAFVEQAQAMPRQSGILDRDILSVANGEVFVGFSSPAGDTLHDLFIRRLGRKPLVVPAEKRRPLRARASTALAACQRNNQWPA